MGRDLSNLKSVIFHDENIIHDTLHRLWFGVAFKTSYYILSEFAFLSIRFKFVAEYRCTKRVKCKHLGVKGDFHAYNVAFIRQAFSEINLLRRLENLAFHGKTCKNKIVWKI